MSLTNINSNLRSERGFTIVELLIVVVVIAILAAITIVSYNGITNRANASSSKSTASTMQKKIELYYSEEGRYPVSLAEMSTNTAKSYYITNANITAQNVTPDATTGKTKVRVNSCGNATPDATNVSGAQITYWLYDSPATATITVGTCTTTATNSWSGV